MGGRSSCEPRVVPGLTLHVEPVLSEATLVLAFEGWNDAGESASLALRFLEKAVRAVPLGELDLEEYLDFTVQRPTLRLDEGETRVIEWPRLVLRYGSIDSSREIVTGVGVEPHLSWRRFCSELAEVVGRLGIQQVVLLGAYLADVVYSRPVEVTGFATSSGGLEAFGVRPSRYEGPTGVVGVLADRLHRDGVQIVSLWAGLPHYIAASPNPRGALALVQRLCEGLGVKVEDEALRHEAASFEERVSALVNADPELLEYVKQLKRREFAQ